ncbi:MAG: DUF3787 domain-containing protein [Defluviitaleaceae bacterium]|nr:DUF3787 domain-containing protein [Defluviitaleaceae bacterium]
MESKNQAMPTDHGLQAYSMGINKEYNSSMYETLSFVSDATKTNETGEPIPDMGVREAKNWVDNGSKL